MKQTARFLSTDSPRTQPHKGCDGTLGGFLATARGVILLVVSTTTVWAQNADQSGASNPMSDADRAQAEAFFESKIRPILVDRCVECHGADKQKAGLRVDSASALTTGGDSGAAITRGNPEKSLLIQVVRYTGDLKMPPKSKLPDSEIALLTEWVRQGAVWPASKDSAPGTTKGKPAGEVTDEDRKFWAFVPLKPVLIPAVADAAWAKGDLDRFILEKLEHAGLKAAPAADRRTLIRRVTFDLHGVPPTPAEIDAFLADDSPEAFARVVDRLLASPRYGERFARHWLDVARFADSNGLDENLAYANAWRYRDYVIAAFNKDKPFDQFIHEQLAGDLLPPAAEIETQLERTVATGFLSLGAKMLAEDDPVKMQMDIIDEQVDTLGRAFMGLTLGCARCHEHKFDPIPQEDYYGLAGIFKSTKTMENFSVVAKWQELPLAAPEVVAKRAEQQQRIDSIKSAITQKQQSETADVLKQARRQVGDLLLAAHAQSRLDSLLATVPVRGPKPGDPVPEGVLLIEAEDFARGNVLKVHDGYGQGIGVLVNKGETPNFTEYDLEIPAAGVYQIELRYAAAAARPNLLSIGGRLVKSDAAGKVTGSWYPDTQTWHLEALVSLPVGKTVLRLENPGPFPHIDKLLLAPARDAGGAPVVLSEEPTSGTGAISRKRSPIVGGFLQQFAAALAATRDKPESLLATWHEFVAGNIPAIAAAAPGEGTAAAVRSRLLAEPVPQSLSELAARYQQLALEATTRWEELQARAETRSVATLSDAVLEEFRKFVYDPQGPLAAPKNVEELFPETVRQELIARRDEQKALEQALPKFPEAMAVTEGQPENLKVHLRGSHLNLGAEVPRRFLQIMPLSQRQGVNSAQSGRLELARWLTDPEHPLTSRVIVNRVWQWHFGEGLVRSPDNFGRLGERPTHPALLDYLAQSLIEDGWSLKALHRRILLSSTWQMSTRFNEQAAELDPENRLLWRSNRRRLEVESLRDSVFAVAGTIDSTMGGTLLPTPNRQYVTSTANVNPVVYDPPRRSIYLPVVRSALYDVFQAFDFADPSVQSGRRDTTTVAPQALFLMNSDLVLKQTRELARQLLAETVSHESDRVERLYLRVLGRPPRTTETNRALAFLEKYSVAAGATSAGTAAPATTPPEVLRERAWQGLCRAVLSSNEFIYVE